MRHLRAIVLVLVLMVAFISGCLSTTGPAQSTSNAFESTSSTSSQTPGEQTGNGTSSMTVAIGTTEINGTFSGYLTAPMNVFDEIERFLNSMNVTLYAFTAEVSGGKTNASITVYVLKLSPSFVPRDFNVTINSRPLNGTVFVAYADRIPITIEAGKGLTTTSQLTVKPEQVFDVEGVWDAQRLNELNGSVILRNDCLELKVFVRKPGDYVFTVFHNGREVSSGGLGVNS